MTDCGVSGANLDGGNLSVDASAVAVLLSGVPQEVLAILPSPHRRLDRVSEVVLAILVALDGVPAELVLAASGAASRGAVSHRRLEADARSRRESPGARASAPASRSESHESHEFFSLLTTSRCVADCCLTKWIER